MTTASHTVHNSLVNTVTNHSSVNDESIGHHHDSILSNPSFTHSLGSSSLTPTDLVQLSSQATDDASCIQSSCSSLSLPESSVILVLYKLFMKLSGCKHHLAGITVSKLYRDIRNFYNTIGFVSLSFFTKTRTVVKMFLSSHLVDISFQVCPKSLLFATI
ncbi:hypothetical protein GEMRC1_005830 [Eukaryota sp. GEM-RC1]